MNLYSFHAKVFSKRFVTLRLHHNDRTLPTLHPNGQDSQTPVTPRKEANTTTHNSDFPAQHNRQVTTPATRCVHPSAYRTCRVAGFAPCMPWYALLVRTWACYSEPGQPRPRTEQTAHVRNSGFTCGTRWNTGHCRTQPIHDGSWGSHTQARDAAFTGTRQTRPTKNMTFPRDKAEKSPC